MGYFYDREGRQTAHTDRNGTLTQTSYNADGNRTMQVCTDREGNRRIMGSWEYDSFGQLKKAVAGGFVYTYEYRPDGKLLKKWSSGRLVVSCTYYRDGSIRSLTDMTGRTTWYGYDSNGRLATLQDEEGNILTEYTYTTAGRIKEIRTPGGMEASYSYDCDGNLIRLRLGKQGKENLLYDARMSYDLNGNRTGRRGFRLGADGRRQEMETAYSYDAMNRLTQENRGETGEKYAYDLNGNRLKKEHFKNGIVDAAEACCYNERNELTQKSDASGMVSYPYDANGNLLSERTKKEASEYRYDLLNRQTCVHTLTGQEQENRYDGEGLHAGIAENGKVSYFQFHNGEILTECDGEGMPIRRHISGMGLSCVQTLDDNAYHIYHRDEQGSTVYITDP